MRGLRVISFLTAVVAALAAAPAAQSQGLADGVPLIPPLLGVNVDRSVVDLAMLAKNGASVDFFELRGTERLPLGSGTAKGSPTNPNGAAALLRAVEWSCDRLERSFVATARNPDGTVDEATNSVRTPSCRDRLLVTAPRRIERGRELRTVVRDRWALGGIDVDICVRRRGDAERRCRRVAIAKGKSTVVMRRKVGAKGLLDIDASIKGKYRTRTQTGVGRAAPRENKPTLLITGDSMIQGVDSFLADRLRSRYRVVSDTRPSTGVSKSGEAPWTSIASSQAKRHAPNVTVVFLGAADSFPLPGPDGRDVECCGPTWIAAYTDRIRAMARSWARSGKGRILWATLPPPRDDRFAPAFSAVNQAITTIAGQQAAVELVRLDRVFSIDGRYADVIDGVDVRDRDGVHLSVAGERRAAKVFADAERGVRP